MAPGNPQAWSRIPGARGSVPRTQDVQKAFLPALQGVLPSSPPTEPRRPVGETGVGVPTRRGGGRAGEGAVGGRVRWVGVARANPEGR